MTIEANVAWYPIQGLMKTEAGFGEPWRPLAFVGILADGSSWLEHSGIERLLAISDLGSHCFEKMTNIFIVS